jgi:hypothetical protein
MDFESLRVLRFYRKKKKKSINLNQIAKHELFRIVFCF